MCNINFVWKANSIKEIDLIALEAVTYNSWTGNSHGEGYLLSNGLVKKSLDKIHPYLEKNILAKKWVVFHERYTTHGGNTIENTQPIETDRIVFLHNGVISITAPADTSDSRMVAEDITKLMNAGTPFKEAFCKVMRENSGSKSIMVYDKQTKKLYYYKNSSSSFYYLYHGDMFFGSTTKENVEYMSKFYGMNAKIHSMVDNRLQLIGNDGTWSILCKVKEPKVKPYAYALKESYSEKSTYPWQWNYWQKDPAKDDTMVKEGFDEYKDPDDVMDGGMK